MRRSLSAAATMGAAEDLPMPRGRGSLATMIERRSLRRVTTAKGKLAATTALQYGRLSRASVVAVPKVKSGGLPPGTLDHGALPIHCSAIGKDGAMDPMSLSVLGATALTKGIDFLYGQATEVLKRRRERDDGGSPSAEVALPGGGPDLIVGELKPLQVDLDAAARLEQDIADLRRALSDYRDGIRAVDPSDRNLLDVTDALRRALEAVYRQPLTFVGEKRRLPETVVRGEVDVEEVHGHAAGVRARVLSGGQITGTARAKTVGPGGEIHGVDVG